MAKRAGRGRQMRTSGRRGRPFATRATLSAGSTPLSSSFLSTDSSLSLSLFTSPPPFLPPFFASDPYVHAREHLSYIQPRRFLASSFFVASAANQPLSLPRSPSPPPSFVPIASRFPSPLSLPLSSLLSACCAPLDSALFVPR